MPENKILFSFMCTAMLVLGLGRLVGPERALAQRPLGIDVYHGDGTINWSNVLASGVTFAWAKASQGTNFTDAAFAINETNAKAAGVLIGAYHYADFNLNTGTNGAVSEAAHFWSVAKNYVTGSGAYLMPMLDVEAPTTNSTKTTLSQWVNQWCITVSNNAAAAGVIVTPVIYCSSSFAGKWFDSTVTQWTPWIAEWPTSPNPQTGAPSPTSPWSTWVFWQYADSSSNPGDADVFNGTAAGLAAYVIGGGTPVITNQPVSQTVLAGANVTFSVGASSASPISYQWRFNSSNLAGATLSSYTTNNVQTSATGSYSVVVSNQFGSVTSSNALLTVNGLPSITGQPQSQIVSVGQNVTFTVADAGTPPLSYQWQFNGTPLPGATAPSCLLTAARSINVGSYSVVVSNGFGWVVSSNATLGLIQDAAWGDNTLGQGGASGISTNLIAIAAGAWHNLGLGADGTVVAWGNDANGQCDVPAGLADALAIAAGGYHSLALRANGSVVAWGADDYGQTNVPAGLDNVIGISAGTWHSVALRANGTVVVWGDNSFGQTNQPARLTNVTAVAAGGSHTLALKADGTVVAWGENTEAEGNVAGQSVVPWGLTNVVAIGAGEYHSLAVKGDGMVVAWGDDSEGQSDVPAGLTNVVAAAGGGGHSVALGADGQVTAWGTDWNGQCDVPPALAPAAGVATGEDHTLVLLEDSLPVPRLLHPARNGNRFSVLAQTLSPKNYALEFKGSLTAANWTAVSTNAGNGALRMLTDPAATGAQRFYRMRQW
jgi:GH25 family lysozyme M1 (1,4-beta-N-acetylmuramidase)